jgi:pimeloyl-ACP methyl ester carboxylesterase
MKNYKVAVDGIHYYYTHNGVQKPPKVILLHGQNTTAKTWEDVGTMKALAKAGHSSIALNLPGPNTDLHPEAWLLECMNKLGIQAPIMVTPSLSTEYIIPYMIKYPKRLSAWVSVANMYLDKYYNIYPDIKFPVLAIWGELDKYAPVEHAYKLVENVENGQYKIIPGATHSPFQTNPVEFNKILIEFIDSLPAR